MSGIKVSYRGSRKTPTYLIPIVIVVLIGGLGLLFWMDDPTETADSSDTVDSPATPAAEADAESSTPESRPAFGALRPDIDPEPLPELETLPARSRVSTTVDEPPTPTTPAPPAPAIDDSAFTAWMTVSQIDTYIRARNAGYERSFWERGHWIFAAEGRWVDGLQEYRIAIEDVPESEDFQWRYRINQTQSRFEQSIDQFLREGFQLVHSQKFNRPDGTARFQGVWRKQPGAPAPVLAVVPPATPESVTPTPKSPPPPTPGDTTPTMDRAPVPFDFEMAPPTIDPPVVASRPPIPQETAPAPRPAPGPRPDSTGRIVIPERRGSVIAPGLLDVNNLPRSL